jgi:FkbH-like protein
MKHAMLTLDYFALSKEAKALKISSAAKVIRIALLADCATQHLATIMRAIAARNGVQAELYEGNYDGVDLEILDPNSALYAFSAQYVVILLSSEKLKARLYASGDRRTFADETIGRLENLWGAFRAHSQATIIQSTFVLPSERAFGNYELKVADSVGSIFTEINYRLAVKARETKNVLLNDVDFLAAAIGRAQWLDARMWNMAKTPCRLEHVPLLAQSLLDTMFAASGLIVKCVVLDLDNTLWGGVIGDDGLEGIALGEFDEGEAFVGFQKFIRELKRRGIILAVVSKNEHANAVLPFREHPHMALKEEDISVFVANWDNKADNIRLIQKTLNIGFDSLVFLDDNPFERNIVREFLPEVVVPELPEDPSLYLQSLADLNLFETASFSEADLQRADQYREEAQRELTKTHFTDINDYLTSLAMEIRLERFNAFNLPRIAQLIQRSNQFNLMTRRYGEAACEAMMKDPSLAPLTLRLADKFGDYGLISVVILKHAGEDLEIDEYLMSCRVLQRGVESFTMNNIFAYAARLGAKRVTGHYLPTKKNDMVKGFFKGFGFEKIADGEGGASKWALAVEAYEPRETFFTPVANEL